MHAIITTNSVDVIVHNDASVMADTIATTNAIVNTIVTTYTVDDRAMVDDSRSCSVANMKNTVIVRVDS
jgi:hypothetical protein